MQSSVTESSASLIENDVNSNGVNSKEMSKLNLLRDQDAPLIKDFSSVNGDIDASLIDQGNGSLGDKDVQISTTLPHDGGTLGGSDNPPVNGNHSFDIETVLTEERNSGKSTESTNSLGESAINRSSSGDKDSSIVIGDSDLLLSASEQNADQGGDDGETSYKNSVALVGDSGIGDSSSGDEVLTTVIGNSNSSLSASERNADQGGDDGETSYKNSVTLGGSDVGGSSSKEGNSDLSSVLFDLELLFSSLEQNADQGGDDRAISRKNSVTLGGSDVGGSSSGGKDSSTVIGNSGSSTYNSGMKKTYSAKNSVNNILNSTYIVKFAAPIAVFSFAVGVAATIIFAVLVVNYPDNNNSKVAFLSIGVAAIIVFIISSIVLLRSKLSDNKSKVPASRDLIEEISQTSETYSSPLKGVDDESAALDQSDSQASIRHVVTDVEVHNVEVHTTNGTSLDIAAAPSL